MRKYEKHVEDSSFEVIFILFVKEHINISCKPEISYIWPEHRL
jgi:hypothetical protein